MVLNVSPKAAIRQMLEKRLGKGNIKIQPSYIRMEHALIANKVPNTFQISQKDASYNARPLELRLGTTDGFVCVEMQVAIYKQINNLTASAERSGNALLYCYPDKEVFDEPATAANVSESDALLAIWNGNYAIKANTEEIIYQDSLLEFLVTPQTQSGSFGTAMPSQGAYYGEQRQYFSLPLIFRGDQKNEIIFNPAQGADTALIGGVGAATEQNYMVIKMNGFLLRDYCQSAAVNEVINMISEGMLSGGAQKQKY